MAAPGEGFFPGQVAIDAYGAGGFRFAGMSHRGAILCLPSGVHAWTADADRPLVEDDFAAVFAEAEPIGVLLVGTGRDIRPLAAPLRAAFRARGITVDAMSTGAAVRTYNIMLAEDRRVAGAFLAVG
jgi:uncharacterized protein